MSDFDSNPFADPDLNNPFKVSFGPSISHRHDASLFVTTNEFLRAPYACHSAREGIGAAAPHLGVVPGPPLRSLRFGLERPQLCVGCPAPRHLPKRVLPSPGIGPARREGSLSYSWELGGWRPRAGGAVTCWASVSGRPRQGPGGCRGGPPWGGVVMGTQGSGSVEEDQRGVMAEVWTRDEGTEYAAIKKIYLYVFII